MSPEERRFEQLAEAHGARVLGYLARRTRSADDSADVFQAVLLVAWRRLGDVPPEDQAALAWLLGTARRCLADHRRSRARRLRATERLSTTIHIVGLDSSAPDERAALVGEVLMNLPEADQELLTLIYWDELSTEQAAQVLDIKPDAGRKRLERARTRMRLQLEAAGLDSSGGLNSRSSLC